jgi:hypothetical protein
VNEPLAPDVATRLVKQIIRNGDVSWSDHVKEELLKDDLTTGDCLNVLRAGAVTESADLERGTWRYRVHTNRMCVVVAFRSECELRIVTTWRKRR